MALCSEEQHVSVAPLMHNLLEHLLGVPEGKHPTLEQIWMSRPVFQHHKEGRTHSGCPEVHSRAGTLQTRGS